MASTEDGAPVGAAAGAGFFSSALVFSGAFGFAGSWAAGAADFGAGSAVAFATGSGFGVGSAVVCGRAPDVRFALSDVVAGAGGGAGDESPAPVVGGAGTGAAAVAAFASGVPSVVGARAPVCAAATTKPRAGSATAGAPAWGAAVVAPAWGAAVVAAAVVAPAAIFARCVHAMPEQATTNAPIANIARVEPRPLERTTGRAAAAAEDGRARVWPSVVEAVGECTEGMTMPGALS